MQISSTLDFRSWVEMRVLPCETCSQTGEILVGWTDGTMISPPEPRFAECPVCLGNGEVKRWELEEFEGMFPSEEEAREMLIERSRFGDGFAPYEQ